MSKWQATVENKAEEFGGKELCPVGKWGYDPRCRGWYAQGRDRGLSDGGVLITAPYLFATGIEVATSATTAIFDPVTGEHVGQTLLDFTPERIFDHLVNTHAEISVVVSPTADATGGDTVIGPGYDAGADPAPVGDVVLPLDSKDLSNRLEFDEKIVTPMKAGGSGYEVFTRTEAEGGHRAYVMAFAPIKLRSLKISRPDDFSTGVANYTEFIFSIGVARREDILRRPFEKIQGDVKEEHQSLIYLYCGLIVALSIFVLVFTSMVSTSSGFPELRAFPRMFSYCLDVLSRYLFSSPSL